MRPPGVPVAADPRPAATVIVLRDSPAGPEVLMVKRSARASFMPNAYVFHHKLNTGFPLICQQKSCVPSDFCGIWYDVRLQVRVYGSNKWGKSRVWLRLWDGVSKS